MELIANAIAMKRRPRRWLRRGGEVGPMSGRSQGYARESPPRASPTQCRFAHSDSQSERPKPPGIKKKTSYIWIKRAHIGAAPCADALIAHSRANHPARGTTCVRKRTARTSQLRKRVESRSRCRGKPARSFGITKSERMARNSMANIGQKESVCRRGTKQTNRYKM